MAQEASGPTKLNKNDIDLTQAVDDQRDFR